MSIDQRTRLHKDVRSLSIAEMTDDVLPTSIGRNGALAARGIQHRQSPSVGLQVDDVDLTISATGQSMSLHSGVENADMVVSLDADALSDLIQDRQTPMSLAMNSRVKLERGSFDDWILWEPIWRALMDGRVVHEPGMVTMHNADGEPLDVTRTFTLDDDRDEAAHFLEQAGFLHIRNAFNVDEMAVLATDIDTAIAEATPDDGASWWASNADGDDMAVRVLFFQERSETFRKMLTDERLLWIGDLPGDGHEKSMSGEGLVKPLGITRGLSDLPWHKDCGQGRHSYMCSRLTVGISVTGADRLSGALGVVPGSHRANTSHFLEKGMDLQPMMLETATGDLTVHCSDTLHRAHPPVERPRKVIYTDFGMPLQDGDRIPETDPEFTREQRANLTSVEDRIDSAAGDDVTT